MNCCMHEERRLFMQRLVEERDAKAEREFSGATALQAAWRGASVRRIADEEIERPKRGGQRPESDEERRARLLKEKLKLDDEIRAELVQLAEKAGLAPVVNVSLDNAKMTKYKQKLAEEKEARRVEAARVIQERARIRQAKLRALGVIGTIKSYTQEEQAVVIQKEWKKHLMRGWHQGRKEEAAALIVQSRWRRMQTHDLGTYRDDPEEQAGGGGGAPGAMCLQKKSFPITRRWSRAGDDPDAPRGGALQPRPRGLHAAPAVAGRPPRREMGQENCKNGRRKTQGPVDGRVERGGGQ